MLSRADEVREELFLKTWCVRPWSWCAGGNIPDLARRVDTAPLELSRGENDPCPMFKSGRCTHEHNPKWRKEAKRIDD